MGVTKEALKNVHTAISIILENTKADEKLVILDHGGYFAFALEDMMNNQQVSERLLGIVEVTENGHYKYEKALIETPAALLSIARTAIKELEDMQVGVSICDAANTIMYSVHTALDSMKNACVLGYGKIGRSIANSLNKRGISQITVIEIDVLRAQLAMKEGHQVIMAHDLRAKREAYQKAQIIFSATGAKALSKADIAYLRNTDNSEKPVTFIASCTSPDDEFNSDFIPELEAVSINRNENRLVCESKFKLSPYKLYDGRQVIILNGGKAVNFAIGGSPGYEICQVWAAILFSVSKIASQEISKSHFVQTLSRNEEVSIGKITLDSFFSQEKEPPKKTTTERNTTVRRHSFSSFFDTGSLKLPVVMQSQEISEKPPFDLN